MAAVSFTRDIPTRSLLAGNTPFLGAFEHIQSITVGSLGASSVTFSEIPQDYRHLQIRGTVTYPGGVNSIGAVANGDTSANYTWHQVYGNGSAAGSNGSTGFTYASFGIKPENTGYPAAFVLDVLDYSSGVKNKTFRALTGSDGNGSGAVALRSSLWMSTAPVVSLTFRFDTAVSFAQHTTFSLYGVR